MKLSLLSNPVKSIHGEIEIPADKSISHRAIMLGAISSGITKIKNVLAGEDCMNTINALKNLNICIEKKDNEIIVFGKGLYGLKTANKPIDCGNSGTTMRLLSGILAAQSFTTILYGDVSLQRRPMQRVANPLNQMGACIATTAGRAPLKIQGQSNLKNITYKMPVASAQVKSSILFAGLYAKGKTIVIEKEITRDHSEKMLQTFGCEIENTNNAITLTPPLELKASDINIPGDISSAAFAIVAAAIVPNSNIIIKNVGVNPTRIGILKILELMGAKIYYLNKRFYGLEPVVDLQIVYAPLQGIEIEQSLVSLAIDEFPILFVAAVCAGGKTIIKGAKELRNKESDRITSMITGFKNLGVNIQELDDGAIIQGGNIQGGVVDSFGDHRIAMAFVIAGAIAKSSVKILNCKNIATSFPDFVETMNSLNLNILSV